MQHIFIKRLQRRAKGCFCFCLYGIGFRKKKEKDGCANLNIHSLTHTNISIIYA